MPRRIAAVILLTLLTSPVALRTSAASSGELAVASLSDDNHARGHFEVRR